MGVAECSAPVAATLAASKGEEAAVDGVDTSFTRAVWIAAALLSGGVGVTTAVPSVAAQSTQLAPQATFATAEDATGAFIAALRQDDKAALARILGSGSARLLNSGDPTADKAQRQRFLASYDAKHTLVPTDADRVTLDVGTNGWPLPIPIVRVGGSWHFDAAAGAQQIVDRRIGRNEIAAIRTSLAYVDAQRAYFDLFKQATGKGAYAQLLVSTQGNYDGLYWPPAEGVPESPLQPLVSQAVDEGYPGDIVAGKPVPYQGYYFRVLKAQGPDASGGAKNYIDAGKMTGGYALLAWPAVHGSSGIMTFEVNQDGIVFQKNLGADTTRRAAAITRFNPDLTWARVEVTP